MVTFPNAKINLGLNIIERRNDGYHNLETVFYPIPLCDVLEVTAASKVSLNVFGLQFDGDIEQNLVIKAYRLLAADFSLPPVEINLIKKIPCGAGLGGGSSDAAFMISLLNKKFDLRLTISEQINYVSKLGADCAFFIQNKPTFATGIGNEFKPINLSLANYYIYLIKPNIHISTTDAYSNIIPQKPQKSLTNLITIPIKEWRKFIINDFEKSIFLRHTELGIIKDKLYQQGAIYASMSGSGSTIFGIFDHKPCQIEIPKNWFNFIDILK